MQGPQAGVVLRTLANRGRKQAGPTSVAQWEGWIEVAGRKGFVMRTLATRGRKRAGPTSVAQWEGWSEAEGPKGNIPYDHTRR